MPRNAAGRATEAGMDFQAEVGTWIAAHILARLPIGGRFGLGTTALPETLRLETGEGLDDTLLTFDDGGRVDVQSKTRASLSANVEGPLGKTVAQLVGMVIAARVAAREIDPTKVRAVLSVTDAAPRSLDALERGCRAFDLGGFWAITKEHRSQAERDALALFETLVRAAWPADAPWPIADADLVVMARLFRIVRFSMNEGENDWREASRVLGGRVYGSEAAGDAALRDLKAIVRGMIGSGAPADRPGLLYALRLRGHDDVRAPDFDADLARLTAAADMELDRLAGHTLLPIAGGVPIPRRSEGPLAAAAATGSIIVIGEPGAGKTGALVSLARARRVAGELVVFLSVDRFPGVAIASDLQSELGLAHPLVEVLAAAPGGSGKMLIVDALDAARGGPAEAVFARVIEAVAATDAAGWSVVASIRTFDLRNGRRFRDALPGSPPDPSFADISLGFVRHFLVPQLDADDLAAAGAQAPALAALMAAAPDRLRELLGNVFNLSLAAQLLADGASPHSIRGVSTQSDLIDAYEDHRLVGTKLRRAAAATVDAMVRRRRLAIRKVTIAHDSLDDVIHSGVLTEDGDLVSFAHHVLFDHVAGRFMLEWSDPHVLIDQIGGDTAIALMLAPSVRFAVERLWRSDGDGKAAVWRFVAAAYADARVDPVLANVALRTAAERVSGPADVVGLTRLLRERAADDSSAIVASRLAHFVGLRTASSGGGAPAVALAWASVAEAILGTDQRGLSDAARLLLHHLFETADLEWPALLTVFGRAARALLKMAWDAVPPMPQTATIAIRSVGRSFGSDPAMSRALLDRALRDPHFSARADREATWIAEQILPIARSDPDFAIEIFFVLYSREINDTSASHLGGHASRILPLSSNRRQDYEHSRYELGSRVDRLLGISARAGTRAVIEAVIGSADRSEARARGRERVHLPDQPAFVLVGRDHASRPWDQREAEDPVRQDDVLTRYVAFLRACPVDAFLESAEAASTRYSSPAVWTRLLGVGAERVTEVMRQLWPFSCDRALLTHWDTARDAVRFLAAAYRTQDVESRAAFEARAVDPGPFADEFEERAWRNMLRHLLSILPADELATDAMRAMRDDFAAAGELDGIPTQDPFPAGGWESAGGLMHDLLLDQGIGAAGRLEARMIAQSEALSESIQRTPQGSGTLELADLWTEVEATLGFLDAHAPDLRDELEQTVWGPISNAVERIASSEAYASGADGLPTIEALLVVLGRLWASRFPEPGEDAGDFLAWSDCEVRVYAARSYVSLADRFGTDRPEILDAFGEILSDRVPQVRVQATQNLLVLHRAAPTLMWALAERVARDESHHRVLGAFVGNVVSRLRWRDVDRCEAMLEAVLARIDSDEDVEAERRDPLESALGGVAAQLWVGQGRPTALHWVTDWAADPARHLERLTSVISPLRTTFFARYGSGAATGSLMSDRAQRVAMVILEASSTMAASCRAALVEGRAEGGEREALIAGYRAAEQVIEHIAMQLYFGSGAYSGNEGRPAGLTNPGAMRLFLDDYRQLLGCLATSHEPAAQHHLVELYEHLIPGDPEGVFDALHALLVGAGAREGYHHEGLAVIAIVRLITRYLADHRSIFEDDSRRDRLVQILRLFSDVGWPDAVKLLYDLPELLR